MVAGLQPVDHFAPNIYPLPDGTTLKILPTPLIFHSDNQRHRFIVGPFGTGKSSTCCNEIFFRASNQAPGPDGIRRSRWVIIRNTYGQLFDTTIKTWLDWFPEATYGKFTKLPRPEHAMKWEVEQGGKITHVHCEILFRALDRPEHVANLLSLEVTGAWINEAREIPLAIFDAVDARIGRYPSKRMGGCGWHGTIMDSNPPDEDHWLVKRFEEENFPGYKVYHQGADENVENLPTGYYDNLAVGKSPEWIKIYLKGEYGFIADGKPVYPDFVYNVHVAEEPIMPLPNVPVFCGFDFGLTPAAIWMQMAPWGQLLILHEEISENMGISRFSSIVQEAQNALFGDNSDFRYYGDPSGGSRSQTDEKTCFQILSQQGMDCLPGPIDDTSRKEPVRKLLNTMIEGKPGILVSPTCKFIKKGLMGGYHYRELGNTGLFTEKPVKDIYSHPMEAMEYAVWGVCGIGSRRPKKKRKAARRRSAMTV